ncbi:MAG TPA: 4'-phosphopantetheinyl transferase superfamily protein, partial [Ktedonobacterales bacterium]|nr:4'-phosphopantetheinyl transferase superfamily protein [Ktedonobacterales bacterium]
HGKPYLASSTVRLPLQFNVSHSEECALIALAHDLELGVDIEYMRPLDDMDAIARTVFSPHERATLAALDGPRRHEAFYACWARKEAYIKAIGRGLSFPLDNFDVALPPDEPPRLLAVRGNPAEVARWRYYLLPPVPDYATALAVESDAIEVKSWCWAGTA